MAKANTNTDFVVRFWTIEVAVGLVFLDQLTKFMIRRSIPLGHYVEVIPGFFSLSHVENTGAAWGMFSGYTFGLGIFSLFALGFVIWKRKELFLGGSVLNQWMFALITAGITGNLIDRLGRSAVTDFLHFYYRDWVYPSFNVADAAICISVGLYFYYHFRFGKKTDVPAAAES